VLKIDKKFDKNWQKILKKNRKKNIFAQIELSAHFSECDSKLIARLQALFLRENNFFHFFKALCLGMYLGYTSEYRFKNFVKL